MAPQRRWPQNAEETRQETIQAARDGLELLAAARRNLKSNPGLAEVQIADAQRLFADIQRLMVEAKVGR